MRDLLIDYVDDLLDRYTTDEVGETQRSKYEDMGDLDKIGLVLTTLYQEIDKNRDLETIMDDLDTNMVINFDYNNY